MLRGHELSCIGLSGANIIAIDINRPNVWKGLLEKVRRSCGTVTFPVDKVSLATQNALWKQSA